MPVVGTLWASANDAARIDRARSAVLLVGGYDGSGNYGDVIQLATALETVQRLPGGPLAVVVVEREMRAHHETLACRYPGRLDAVAAHYDAGERSFEDDLVELPSGAAPARSALYMYGGGHLNRRWGARKIAHLAAAESLARGRERKPVAASGLQLDEAVVAPGGIAHELLSRASWIGVRDSDSLGLVRANLPNANDGRAVLAGDDALPLLPRGTAAAEPVVNLHLNDGVWVSDDPDAMIRGVASLLRELGRAAAMPLRLQPVIAYEDPRVSERRVVAGLLDRHGGELEEGGFTEPLAPIDVLDDALDGDLAGFRRARLTVSCSYHVTLTSLMAGIPALLMAENEYYEQKATGLRDLFDLDPGLIGVAVSPAAAATAAEVLADGPVRTVLLDHLRTHAGEVSERHERGRVEVAAALEGGLRESRRRGGLRRLLRGA